MLCYGSGRIYWQLWQGSTVFVEDILAWLPLEGQTTREIMFQKIADFFKDNRLNLDQVNLLVTEGAPSMTEEDERLVFVTEHDISSLHHTPECIVRPTQGWVEKYHGLGEVQYKFYHLPVFNTDCKLLVDVSAELGDLLLYNYVRWLSKGNALQSVNCGRRFFTFLCECKHKKAIELLL